MSERTLDVTGLAAKLESMADHAVGSNPVVLAAAMREAVTALTARAERIAELEREVRMGERALKSSEAFVAEVQRDLAAAIEREKKAGALAKWYADSNWQLIAEIDRLKAALKTVGDDYPGSSCQKWCYQQAGLDLPENPMLAAIDAARSK